MEISNGENNSALIKGNAESRKTESGQAVETNNASNSVNPAANEENTWLVRTLENIYLKVSENHDATLQLCSKFEDFSNQENRRNDDYKSHFDAMYAKVLEGTENNAPCDNVNNITLSMSGHFDTGVESTPKADSSSNKIEECEYLTQVGPGDLVLILDSTLFNETETVNLAETTEGDKAGSSSTVEEKKDEQNKSVDTGTNTGSYCTVEEREDEQNKSVDAELNTVSSCTVEERKDEQNKSVDAGTNTGSSCTVEEWKDEQNKSVDAGTNTGSSCTVEEWKDEQNKSVDPGANTGSSCTVEEKKDEQNKSVDPGTNTGSSCIVEEREDEQNKSVDPGTNTGSSCIVEEREDEQNQSVNPGMNRVSKEQETAGSLNTRGKIRILDTYDFKSKHLEPIIAVEGNVLSISIDVSNFDSENITCVIVGDKVDVQARVSRRNNFGSETHEIHQVFQVPALADKQKFTACLKNGVLRLEAPMKQVTYEIIK